MTTQKSLLLLAFLATLLFSSCSRNIYPDRSQFIKDGDQLPTVNTSGYKSVQLRPAQDSSLALALAISGGGSRAANLGIGVMLGLEKMQLPSGRNALQEIDYLSTVSGGGFAGGAYIASLYDHHENQRDTVFSLHAYLDKNIRKDLSYSYTKPLFWALFNPRLWFSYLDDGDALERAIDDRVLGYRRRRSEWKAEGPVPSIMLGDLFVDRQQSEQPVRYPMMVANGSLLDKMGIFPYTPDILETYEICGYSHRVKKYECKEAFSNYQMPLSVGIKASGSFPALISNTTMESTYSDDRRFLHIIDGAMTDNFGYKTAIDLLQQDRAKRGKVLMVVDADNSGNTYTFAKKQTARLSFKVFGRLASSGLEARRITLPSDLADLGSRLHFTPIIFSFNVLIRNNENQPPPIIEIEKEQKRLIQRLEEELKGGGKPLTSFELQILYELVTNISTKYTITADEQELLLLCGQKIVALLEVEIRKALE
ncbi:MAG: patatin-like phospholipase family protein [Bacteroidota bacterium]